VSTPDLQPDVEEVLQTEEPAGYEPTVKVCVEGPVRTQALPGKGGATFTRTVSTTPTRLVGADHRRRTVSIQAEDNLYVAFSRAGIQSAIDTPDNHEAFLYYAAASPILTVGATVEVWVAAITSTAKVSVFTELWATGEGVE